MNRAKLDKIRCRVNELRNKGGIKSSDLEALAKAVGRVLIDRGKHPTWVNENFPGLRPLSIPRHGSKDLNKFTANFILDQLELDLAQWEEEVEA